MKATVCVLCALAGAAWGLDFTFSGPDSVRDAGVPIDVGYYGAPVMFDWDLDGAKDMVVGQFTSGYIRFYHNIGPDSAPEFNGFEYLQASGSQITLPSG
ncbi:MAG: hypothetical protein R6X13_02290 [bacterium]